MRNKGSNQQKRQRKTLQVAKSTQADASNGRARAQLEQRGAQFAWLQTEAVCWPATPEVRMLRTSSYRKKQGILRQEFQEGCQAAPACPVEISHSNDIQSGFICKQLWPGERECNGRFVVKRKDVSAKIAAARASGQQVPAEGSLCIATPLLT